METFSSGFMGSFKTGDNINYNLDIVRLLYDCKKKLEAQETTKLNKPIIIFFATIVEAVLEDLIMKAQDYTIEGVPNIEENTLEDIRDKKIKRFSAYIDCCKKHQLISNHSNNNECVFSKLNELRELRNKIHITGEKHESEYFTNEARKKARSCLVDILQEMQKYERDYKFVKYFTVPGD